MRNKREKTWFIPESLKKTLARNEYTIRKSRRYSYTPAFTIKDKDKNEVFYFIIGDYRRRNLHNYIISEIKEKIQENRQVYRSFTTSQDLIIQKINCLMLEELLKTLKK